MPKDASKKPGEWRSARALEPPVGDASATERAAKQIYELRMAHEKARAAMDALENLEMLEDAPQAGMPAAKARLEAAAKALRDGVAASSKAAVTMAYDRRKFRLEIANRMQVTPIHASMRVMQRGAVRPENSCGEARYLSVGVRRRWPQVTRA